jgi:NADH:ubiquinone oxidoreductase subunit F (NADH-binding)/NADH:ubiquinone oxidoreductase subunit E
MSLESLVARRGGAHDVLDQLEQAGAAHDGIEVDERAVAQRTGVPLAAVHGAATYYADLRASRGRRHVRVCTGTACFVASAGGQHVVEVESALGVKVGECAPDGEVSLQAVRCLGYCYAGPAALDGDRVYAGPDLGAQVTGASDQVASEIPATAVVDPVLLDSALEWSVWPEILRTGARHRVLDEVRASGLRGRGGAGFPAAAKWEAVLAAPAGPKFVVANGDEGDPGSFSDRLLMQQYPAKVLEGLALAGFACGAGRGFVYVRSEYAAAFDAMSHAVAQARAAGHLRPDVFDVQVVRGAGSYVAGEETSLLRSLAGLRAAVRAKPPFPTTHGYLGFPTAVNNVETLAAVPAIVARGGARHARLGQAPETGTLLVCLNERFARPGVYEVELGTPIRQIVSTLGGGMREGRTLVALQIGGPLGGFLIPSELDLPLLDSALARAGAALGHGGIVAVDDLVPKEALLKHLWQFAADESCGTCTPCREGTLIGARDPQAAGPYLAVMEQTSLCAFGRNVPRAVRSLRKAVGQPWN